MADEKTESTEAPAVATPTAEGPTGEPVGAGPEGGPVKGDPSSEQVATAAQSHVAGRVGPPSIQQDADAPEHTGEGIEQIKPGEVRPAETAIEGGPVPPGETPAVVVARALEQDTEGGSESTPAATSGDSSESPASSPGETSTSSTKTDSAGTSEPAESTSGKSSK